jgi:hypothetical protein
VRRAPPDLPLPAAAGLLFHGGWCVLILVQFLVEGPPVSCAQRCGATPHRGRGAGKASCAAEQMQQRAPCSARERACDRDAGDSQAGCKEPWVIASVDHSPTRTGYLDPDRASRSAPHCPVP